MTSRASSGGEPNLAPRNIQLHPAAKRQRHAMTPSLVNNVSEVSSMRSSPAIRRNIFASAPQLETKSREPRRHPQCPSSQSSAPGPKPQSRPATCLVRPPSGRGTLAFPPNKMQLMLSCMLIPPHRTRRCHLDRKCASSRPSLTA
ncbi:hypothetical protein K456DRAFT_571549 [Colletotrichum gloeosporioides 23]|nr:hypothetical protein K456DRAFT_571549 [Colletotrichum gloeosporioides 23]